MRYLSVCSGIEAASVAWRPLGWEPVAFSEIEAFPSAVLAHHYPDTPNWGDMTRFEEWPDADVDVLAGGTPCQSFSVAGLRAGLDDPRGNLMLTYLAIAAKYRPRWVVWENVPGVLSSNGGRDFGAFLRGLGECGYGWSYRVLDAQHFGVAQRRRRVFVVGHLGDWRPAAAVLLEPESLRRDSAPSREAREGAPAGSENGIGADGQPYRVANTLTQRMHKGINTTLDEGQTPVVCSLGERTHALTGEGFDASEDGTGRGTPVVAFDTTQITHPANYSNPQPGDPCHPLAAAAHAPAIAFNARQDPDAWDERTGPLDTDGATQAVAFSCKDYGADAGETAPTLRAMGHDGSHANAGGPVAAVQGVSVRRLTPVECERLQGFQDDYTRIPWRGKPASACPDGPRYKAVGNSWPVPCAAWIGRRIKLFEEVAPNEKPEL